MLLKGAIKMKRILAIIISVAMIATMLAVSVSAANLTKDNVLGGTNGVDTFEPTTPDGEDINVTVKSVTHKYAVDITYGVSDLEIGGTITWNVETMKYDVNGHALTNVDREFIVNNRSDLPVYAYATISNTNPLDGIEIVADKNSADNKLTVAKATAGYGAANGQSTKGTITVSLKSGDWNSVAVYYAAKASNEGTDTFRIATVTVTITK